MYTSLLFIQMRVKSFKSHSVLFKFWKEYDDDDDISRGRFYSKFVDILTKHVA